MARILVFGDSITWGAWDTEGGWVQRLRKFLDLENIFDPTLYFAVYNMGISGDTSADVAKRLDFETRQRMNENDEIIYIFAIGANDTWLMKSKKGGLHIKPEAFKKNLEKIIKTARKYSKKIMFVGIAGVDEARTTPISWNTDVTFKNNVLKKYDEIIRSVCKSKKVLYMEAPRMDKYLLEDGVHPNDRGHELIFQAVKDFLVKNKLVS